MPKLVVDQLFGLLASSLHRFMLTFGWTGIHTLNISIAVYFSEWVVADDNDDHVVDDDDDEHTKRAYPISIAHSVFQF